MCESSHNWNHRPGRAVGIKDWESYIVIDKSPFRPAGVYNLREDASKANRVLGWEATKKFGDLVKFMVGADMRRLESVAD